MTELVELKGTSPETNTNTTTTGEIITEVEKRSNNLKPVLTTFPPSPNWHTPTCSAIDSQLGLYYYCAVTVVYSFEVVGLRYVNSWVAHEERVTTIGIWNQPPTTTTTTTTTTNQEEWEKARVVTGGDDFKVKLWRPNLTPRPLHKGNRGPVAEHQLHKKRITCVHWSLLGTRIISGDSSGRVILWYPEEETHIEATLSLSKILCMDTKLTSDSDELLSVGFENGSILVTSLSDPTLSQVLYRITNSGTKVLSLSWLPGFGSYPTEECHSFIAGLDDHTVRFWSDLQKSVTKPQKISIPNIRKTRTTQTWVTVTCYLNYHNRPTVLLGSNIGRLFQWDPSRGDKLLPFADSTRNIGHSRSIYSILPYYSTQGSYVMTYSQDRRIISWDIASESILTSISTLGGPARSIDFPNFRPSFSAVGVADSAIRLWNYQEESEFCPSHCSKSLWKTESSSVTRVQFHPEEEGVLAFGTGSGLVACYEKIYDIIPMQLMIPEPTKCHYRNRGAVIGLQWVRYDWVVPMNSQAYDIDQEDLNQLLGLLDQDSPEEANQKPHQPSPDTFALVSLDITGVLNCNFYKAKSDANLSPLFSWNRSNEQILQFSFAAQSPWLALGYDTEELKVFAMPEGSLIYQCTGKLGAVVALAWSPDDTILAVGHDTGLITLHSSSQFISPGSTLATYPYPELRLAKHTRDVSGLSWSPHRPNQLASSSLDGSTIVWDITIRKQVAVFYTHSSCPALCCRFCPLDPNSVITCADDCSVWIWDLNLHPPRATTRKPLSKRREPPVMIVEPTREIAKKSRRTPNSEGKSQSGRMKTTSMDELVTLTSQATIAEADLLPVDVSSDDPTSWVHKLWRGELLESIQNLSSTEQSQADLNQWLLHLCLSPLAGPEVYSHMLTQLAHKFRDAEEHPRLSATLYAASGQLPEALSCLTSRRLYTDAIQLARSRYPPHHDQLRHLYLEYAKYLQDTEKFEASCRYFLAAQSPAAAITVISLRNTPAALLVALNLAVQYQDPTLDLRLWRYIVSHLRHGTHAPALHRLTQFPMSPTILAYLLLILTDQWVHSLPPPAPLPTTKENLKRVLYKETHQSPPIEVTPTPIKKSETEEVNPDAIMMDDGEVNPDAIKMDDEEEVNPDPIKVDDEVNPGAIKVNDEVNPGAIKVNDEVNPDAIKVDDEVNSDAIKVDDEVNSDAIKVDDEVNSDAIKVDDEVNPDTIKLDVEESNPDAIDLNGGSHPEVTKMEGGQINPDGIEMDEEETNPDAIEVDDDHNKINLGANDAPPTMPTPFIDPTLLTHLATHHLTISSPLTITHPNLPTPSPPLATLLTQYLHPHQGDLPPEVQPTLEKLEEWAGL